MTNLQIAVALVDACVVVSVLGWLSVELVRLCLARRGLSRAERQWVDHGARCTRCYPVIQSKGPTWLLCETGRTLGAAATGYRWCSLADVLRESDGVPVERGN